MSIKKFLFEVGDFFYKYSINALLISLRIIIIEYNKIYKNIKFIYKNFISLLIWSVIKKIKTKSDLAMKLYGDVMKSNPPGEVVWRLPNGNAIKFNIDGSSLGNLGRADFGGVI